jgi:signal transduction histidine kinase
VSRRTAAHLAWSLCLLALTFVAVTMVLDLLARPDDPLPARAGRGLYLGSAIPVSLVGALVVARRPGNRIGLLVLASGVLTAVDQWTWDYVAYGRVRGLPGATAVAWLGNWTWTAPVAGLLFTLLLFPDGRLPSRRWRPVGWAVTAWTATLTLLGALGAGVYGGPPLLRTGWPTRGVLAGLEGAVFAAFPVLLATVAAAAVARFRRAGGDQRAQLGWLAYAAALVAVVWSLPPTHEIGSWARAVANLTLWTVPLAIGVAVLRYRLYAIDRIVNRSLVYAALTACVGGVYVGVVSVLEALFGERGPVVSVLATMAVATVFAPLRARVQRAVDRLLYGQRGEPHAVISQLGRRLSATLASEEVVPTIVETVGRALKLPYVALELTQDGHPRQAAVYGTPTEDTLELPLSHQGQGLGRLLFAPRDPDRAFSAGEHSLLEHLAQQAGLAVYSAALSADLQRSRERLVLTREEERRRLRNDLHDRLGPALASVAYQLDAARLAGNTDAADTAALLATLSTDVRHALAEIRRLVDGLRDPVLDSLGLTGAVEAFGARLGTVARATGGLRIVVDAPAPLPPLPAAVEVAAYRIAREALTNVVRHSGARRCVAVLRTGPHGDLELEVTDDGRGIGRGSARGVGLTSMAERAAELGGTVTTGPGPDGGTRVAARLPLPHGTPDSRTDRQARARPQADLRNTATPGEWAPWES